MTTAPSWLLVLGAIAAAAMLAELALRSTGYGAPLLYAADPAYEYFPLPNQHAHRFGMRLDTNSFGMRSQDFDAARDRRRRVLVLGDSVVNGGNWTDQDALATSRLTSDALLSLNVSAGGWGPGNLLAYVERHGLYGANGVIVVLSSHDWTDDRTFGPLHSYETPGRRPASAIARWIDQYLLGGPARESARVQRPAREGDAQASLGALLQRLQGDHACVVLHWTAHELANGADPDMQRIATLAASSGAKLVSTEPYYRGALGRGENLFRDDIHLTDNGQAALANALRSCLDGA